MYALLAILTVVLLVGIAIGLVLQQMLYSRLSTEHPKALEILDESSAGIMAFQRYFWKRQYLGLGDGSFTRRADSLRRYWKACFAYFILVVVALWIAFALWPGPAVRVRLSLAPLGPSVDGSAKFIVGLTNNSYKWMDVLVGGAAPDWQGGMALRDEQTLVLAPRSGMRVAVPVSGGTSSWAVAAYYRLHMGYAESHLRLVGWRLKLCGPYSPEFAQWNDIKVDLRR
jgi:hypothetical protein